MIEAWFPVLIISLIVVLSGLAALLVQSYRGESLQQAEEPHLFPWYRDRHPRAQVTSHIPTSAATKDASAAWRELFRQDAVRHGAESGRTASHTGARRWRNLPSR